MTNAFRSKEGLDSRGIKMKYYKRLKEYKESNVSLTVEPKLEAYSYNWWLFVTRYKGLVIFNDTNYSNPTCKHQSKVRSVLDDLNIKIDIELNHTVKTLGQYGPPTMYKGENSPLDGDYVKAAIEDEIENINLENKKITDLIKKPRTHKAKNQERKQQILQNKKQIKKLKKVLRSKK